MARFLSTNHNSLLRIATNEIALFRINHRSRQMSQMAFFRAKAGQRRGKKPAFAFCFEIKKGFRYYRGQPKAGTGHKIHFVPFVFSKSRFQGPVFRCDKTVVIASLLEAIEGIPDKDYNIWGNENFHNIYERKLHERKRKSGYLERRRIYKRPLHLRVDLFSRIKANIFQSYLYINLL